MELSIDEKATEKQVSYATDIANRLNLQLPSEYTKQAYSQFISDNVDAFKRAKQSYYADVDEDMALVYGSCLEDIL